MPRLAALLAGTSLCLVPASHAQTRVPVKGGTLHLTQRRAVTTVRWSHDGLVSKAVLPSNEDDVMRLAGVELLGSPGPGVFVLLVTYLSSPRNPMGHCGAGEETYVRVVSFAGAPHQAFAQRVASCWYSTEDATAAYEGPGGFVIDKTTIDPAPGEHRRTHYTVSTRGVVTERSHELLPLE